ncbi:thioredoxin domain-containing protein 16 [Genypterus blacodes]|uniref:thioredoxin domain-containing protein 16 n=1 Tax=Genypterus blacodes TaxID=154954 RepID=UPI003F7656EC
MVWLSLAVVLVWMSAEQCVAMDSVQCTAKEFQEKLSSGKTLLVYFENEVCPTVSEFLSQLEKSAEALQDYGITVAKVNCNKEPVAKFCTGEKIMKKAYLFRSGEVLKRFELDTVSDVDAIVSHVLFTILFDEVRYVQSDAELQALERTASGKTNMVLGYVKTLGTKEHRSLMETAFVYGSKYQFIFTTGGPVLKYLGVCSDCTSSGVWFLHSRVPQGSMARCPLTPMRKPLSTLGLYSFLQLMDAPLVSEVHEDPASVQPLQPPHHQVAQLFLFSRPSTAHQDLDTANALAQKLRGVALVVLVHRESPTVKTPAEYNAAYRLPGQGSAIQFLALKELEDVVKILMNEPTEENQEEEVDAMQERELLDVLDDEVEVSLQNNRGKMPKMDLIIDLTSDNFHTTVAESSLTVALFYFKWESVSVAVLRSFIEVAKKLEDSDIEDVQMAVVDCGEWNNLCTATPTGALPIPFQPIKAYPTVLLLRPQESAQHYRGMLGMEALRRFIMLSRKASPVLLSTQEEVTSFLQEAPGYKPDKVLGLFETSSHTDVSVFTEAAHSLRGEVLTGLLTGELAQKWAAEHSAALPAVLAFPSWINPTAPLALPLPSTASELVAHIEAAQLHTMPELTVENLPSFLSLGKALLILFVEDSTCSMKRTETMAALEEMRQAAVELRDGSYLACWIHLGRTSEAISVLNSYLNMVPPLPALLLAHLPSSENIYLYPTDTSITKASVMQWLQSVEEGAEQHAGMMGGEHFVPVAPLYDFLAIMDREAPGSAQQQTHKSKAMAAEEERAKKEEEEKRRFAEEASNFPAAPLHTEL